MTGLIARLHIKEGKMDIAIDAIKELMVHVAKEAGTLVYTLNKDESDPDSLVIMERYIDKAALNAHSSTPHFARFIEKTSSFIEGELEITMLEEIHSI